jgi:hypothetical protein
MSAAAPVRRAAQVRRPSAMPLPRTAPGRVASPPKPATAVRPRLVVVASRHSTAGRLPFVIVIGAVLVGGLVGVLLLHTLAAQYAFRATGMQTRLATLTDEAQQQSQVVAADSSPIALQRRAAALGMVPTSISTFHRRADGRAIAVQTPIYVAPSSAAGSLPATSATTSASGKSGKSGKAGTPPASGTTSKTGKAGTSPASPASGKQPTTKAPVTKAPTTKAPVKHHK